MITRPLELASKLRNPPPSFDWLFFVNVGAVALFFVLFGSRFVLAPGLGVNFRLPEATSAEAGARYHTHVIRVMNSGQILTDDGLRTLAELGPWMRAEAEKVSQPSILLIASSDVRVALTAEIASLAHEHGFTLTLAAKEAARSEAPVAR